mmetsp:Transcript_74130/g.66702  ORF Transcript_74130/g.66702 Transcript_74130/m.66702 type:complete len:184 (+) Transcript_74130:19-570(+)
MLHRNRNMIFNLLTIIYLIGYVYSEMCLVSPYQRGGLVPDDQLNSEHSPACNVRNTYENGTDPGKPPCYGRSKSDERITQFIGRNALQVFIAQKIQDWYNPANPGNFTFNLLQYNGDNKAPSFVKTFGSIPDTNSSKEFYQINATIPSNLSQDHYVVQAIYYTNTAVNGTTINFYQCADVEEL